VLNFGLFISFFITSGERPSLHDGGTAFRLFAKLLKGYARESLHFFKFVGIFFRLPPCFF